MSNVGAVFEAILMGGHRIDVARRFRTGFIVAEAIAIVILLHFGHGLFAMASVMGASEVGYVLCCCVASRKVMPQIHIAVKAYEQTVLGELARFAGSYQLVSVLQVLYAAILPVTILHAFGADYSGVYALSLRMINPAQMLEDAFLLSILSGGSMVYASGATERMQNLMHKSFKVTFVFAFIPMAFIACFGPTIVFAWTGQNSPEFHRSIILVAIAGVFQSISILGLVLYRISGKALLDNIRQVLVTRDPVRRYVFRTQTWFSRNPCRVGDRRVLWHVLHDLCRSQDLSPVSSYDLAGGRIEGARGYGWDHRVGVLASHIPLPVIGLRMIAWVRLSVVFAFCALASVPALLLTRFLSISEAERLFRAVVRPRSAQAGLPVPALEVAD